MVLWTGRACLKPWIISKSFPIRPAAMATSNNAIPSPQQAVNFLNIIEKLKVILHFKIVHARSHQVPLKNNHRPAATSYFPCRQPLALAGLSAASKTLKV
jgi:hypothetical protein